MRNFTRQLKTRHLRSCFGVFVVMGLIIGAPATAQSDRNYYVPDIEDTRSLNAKELRSVFSGKTHRGTYSFLRGDIDTYAFSETTFSDGRVEHKQKDRTKELLDTGQWEIEDDTICYDYDDKRLRQACFRIYVVGNCYYHYQVSIQGFPASGFTARSVINGERPDCEPSVV